MLRKGAAVADHGGAQPATLTLSAVRAEGVPDAATIAKREAMVARLEAMAPDEA